MRWWKRLRPHTHLAGWPINYTAGKPGYNADRWRYECKICGAKTAPDRVEHADGGVAVYMPEGWE